MKEIYLDNAATTACAPKILEAMAPYWLKKYGNPSSFNDAGREGEKAINEARKEIALILGARGHEIVFVSSATEANNLAVFGATQKAGGKNHIISTAIEHHSVLEPLKELGRRGFKVTYLPVDKNGMVDLRALERSVSQKTFLISIIYANNEIGSVQPVKKIAKLVKGLKSRPLFHIDAAQAQGHLDLNVNNLGVDLMTLSSHKIHGPKGIAVLYVRQGIQLGPLFYGGGQERGFRSGTEAVPLIKGFAKALETAKKSQESRAKSQERLRDYFVSGLKKIFPEVKINGPDNPQNRVPHIISVTLGGIENEQLLLQLDKAGIRASAGSACASKGIEPSHVLRAIGLSKEEARSTVRFSLSRLTAKSEIDYVLKVLPKAINNVQRLYPKDIKKHYYR